MTDVTRLDLRRRSSGVLLHPTSLPGGPIGTIGATARSFVDWLAAAGQRYWQILPLGPVDSGGSPYNGLSALAGNPLLISTEFLQEEGLIDARDLEAPASLSHTRVDYPGVLRWKNHLLALSHERFRAGASAHLASGFAAFRERNHFWLGDYTLFRALRDQQRERAWTEWPADIRDRRPEALERWRTALDREVERYAFQQFLFDREWHQLRQYANARGVGIIGDIPIFVAHDSADVWSNPEIFELEPSGLPTVVAGVPPDYFSATGQRWGNPLYRWDVLRARDFDWWVARFRRTLMMVDVGRIDHFRGFESYWEIPAEAPTAVEGRWVPGPGAEFFHEIERQLGPLPLIAEDLGLITSGVEELRDALGLPGMRVLQFAFDGDGRNPHLPDNYPELAVAYTGTHDNDTISGWWAAASDEERGRVSAWLGIQEPSNWDFVESVFRSRAALAIVPLQDLLGLGAEARMNDPAMASGSWTWRSPNSPDPELARRLLTLARNTKRASEHES